MSNPFSKPAIVAATVICLGLLAPTAPASAATVGYNVVITPRAGFFDTNFGTGVSASDTFVGTLFFDTVDLTPDGARKTRSLAAGNRPKVRVRTH